MAYIGQGIKQGTFSVLDTSGNTYNGSNVTFSLGTQVGSAAQLLVSHDGVIQLPGTDYTLASGGTQITFSTAPASGASIFIVEISGAVGGTVTPSDASVTSDKIADTAVTSAKLNTAILTGHTDIGANIADADLFLVDDGAGGTLRKTAASRLKTYIGTSPITALNNATENELVTVGSTTTELDAEAKLISDGSGIIIRNAAVGTATSGKADMLVIEGNASGDTAGMSILTANDEFGVIHFGDGDDVDVGKIEYSHSSNFMRFYVNASERVRYLSDGRVCWGVTSQQQDGRFTMQGTFSTNRGLVLKTTENGGTAIYFDNNGTGAGYIQINTNNTVSYNTSSDYRLKENVNYDFDATSRLKQLKPARFNWIADETDTTVDGFLAHEVSNIVPEAIDGVKDATETLTNVVVSSNGNQLATNVEESEWVDGKAATPPLYPSDSTWQASKEVVLPQSIDQAKLVPLLVKTVQELEARIKTLEDA